MRHPNKLLPIWLAGSIAFLMIIVSSRASNATSPTVEDLRKQWAQAKYETQRRDQEAAFKNLIQQAEIVTEHEPENAQAHLWHGTILASFAATKGGIGALKYARAAKEHLELALKYDPSGNSGFGHGVLGTLYSRVPGWPLSFGDKEKAREYLLTALKIAPQSMDSHFYYGNFLLEQGEYGLAREQLLQAKQSPIYQGDEIAFRGRLREINQSLSKLIPN